MIKKKKSYQAVSEGLPYRTGGQVCLGCSRTPRHTTGWELAGELVSVECGEALSGKSLNQWERLPLSGVGEPLPRLFKSLLAAICQRG